MERPLEVNQEEEEKEEEVQREGEKEKGDVCAWRDDPNSTTCRRRAHSDQMDNEASKSDLERRVDELEGTLEHVNRDRALLLARALEDRRVFFLEVEKFKEALWATRHAADDAAATNSAQKRMLFREVKSLRSQHDYALAQLMLARTERDTSKRKLQEERGVFQRRQEELDANLVQAMQDRQEALAWAETAQKANPSLGDDNDEVVAHARAQNSFLRKEIKFLRRHWTSTRTLLSSIRIEHDERLQEVQREKETIGTKHEELEKELAGILTEKDQLLERIQHLDERLAEAREREESLRRIEEDKIDVEGRLHMLERTLQEQTAEVHTLQSGLQSWQETATRLETSLNEQRATAGDALAQRDEQLVQAQIEKVAVLNESRKLEQRISDLTADVEKERAAKIMARESADSLEGRVHELQEELERVQAERDEALCKVQWAEARLHNSDEKEERDHMEGKTEVENTEEIGAKEVAVLREALRVARVECLAAEEGRDHLERDVKDVRRRLAQADVERQRLVETSREERRFLLDEVNELREKLAQAESDNQYLSEELSAATNVPSTRKPWDVFKATLPRMTRGGPR
eukprot:TRINITY_DN26040_c0_g1_i2.p2 TRINITY_DN26040_c0_g1~~TRINITY_DN26040_c0_g1_i2.p2  ORF type:complete len:608 (+),score=182.90 TRINITY_DN26040_c0_g1_i2:85-1824(+)